MYKYELNICIISSNVYLQTELEKVSPIEGFSYNFKTTDTFCSSVADSSIFIVEDNEDVLADISGAKNADATVIYYGLEPKQYKYFNDFWQKPISVQGIIFNFNNIMDRIKLDKDCRLNQNYLDTLINNTPDLVWFKDIKGAHVKVNDSFCKAVKKSRADIEGRGHYYIWDITPEDYSSGEYVCLESEGMVIEAGRCMTFEEQVKTKDGMRMFVTVKTPIFDEYGSVLGTVGQAHDLTELSNVSMEMALFIENMPFGVIVSDVDDVILNTNTVMENISGFSREFMIGSKANLTKEKTITYIEDTPEKKAAIMEIEFKGEHRSFEMTKIHITDVFKNSMGIMRIFRDITTERQLEKQVIKSANTDFLTGLHNRRYFYKYVNTYCVGKPVSVLSMDLDNFKGINDTYGHHAGDEALVLVADVLRHSFDGDLVVRNGGDEFLVVMLEDDIKVIERKTRAALDNIKNAFNAREEFSNTSASIGVAVTPSLDNDLEQILKKSDTALYSAKRNHKGSYCIYSD